MQFLTWSSGLIDYDNAISTLYWNMSHASFFPPDRLSLFCEPFIRLCFSLHTFTSPWSSTNNVVHTQQQLCSFRCGANNSSLELVCLQNTQFCHVANLILEKIKTGARHTPADGLSESGNEICAVKTSIVCEDGGELSECKSKGIDS